MKLVIDISMTLFKNRTMNSNQPNYAKRMENFANDPPLQLTLRVMQRTFSNPRYWIGFVAVIAILTITGPFSTLESLEFAPRLVYWASISLVTFPLGMASSVFFGSYFYQRKIPETLSRILGGVMGGLPIGLFVWLVNIYLTDNSLGNFQGLLTLTGYTVVISAAVSLLYYLIESSMRPDLSSDLVSGEMSNENRSSSDMSFFKRLPVELGKDIISLQAQDHYIKVTTTKGSEMILLRLADAEQELAAISGIRIHRSWWIAKKHAKGLSRDNNKLMLELSNGEMVPVSRSYAKDVRSFLDS